MKAAHVGERGLSAMMPSAESLAARIRMARRELTQDEFAARLSISKSTIGKYERGERSPEADILARMRSELGIDVNWLLTGAGAMLASERHQEQISSTGQADMDNDCMIPVVQDLPVSIDEELNGRVVDGIARLYKEEGVTLPPIDLGRLAARMYTDIVNTTDDPDERPIALKALLAQLRRSLRVPITSTQGKQRA